MDTEAADYLKIQLGCNVSMAVTQISQVLQLARVWRLCMVVLKQVMRY